MCDQVGGERPHELLGVATLDHQLLAFVDRHPPELEGRGVRAVLDVSLELRFRGPRALGRLTRAMVLLRARPAAEWITRFQRHRRQRRPADRAPLHACNGTGCPSVRGGSSRGPLADLTLSGYNVGR
jgi:hypothetical protein